VGDSAVPPLGGEDAEMLEVTMVSVDEVQPWRVVL